MHTPDLPHVQHASEARGRLTRRIVTSLTLIPVSMAIVWVGGIAYSAMILGVALILLLEYAGITRQGRPLLLWGALGLVYIGAPALALIALRGADDAGRTWALLALLVTWATDTSAYVGGRWLGRTPLAPRLSPGKTVEGAIAGWIGGSLAGGVVLVASGSLSASLVPLILTAPLAGIAGDLVESALKRRFGVKDSHLPRLNLLPGHGGVLDRMDGLLFVSVVCALYLTALGRLG